MNATTKSSLFRKILTGSLIFYVFSGVSSLLNYAFYPVISRFVSVQEYGEIQFLVAMFTQLAVGFVVLNILAIIIGAEIKSKNEQRQTITSLNFVACIIVSAIVIVGSAILYANQSTLSLSSSLSIGALSLSLLINVPFTIAIGHLQGNGRFVASGVIGMLGALFKLVFSLLFVVLGFGVAGAIFGIGLGMVVSLILIAIVEKLNSTDHEARLKITSQGNHYTRLSFIKKRAIVAMVVITIVTLLASADSISSRIYLDTYAAGQYAAVATIAKIILAATSPLMWLALPHAVTRDRLRIIGLLKVTTVVAVAIGATLSLLPPQAITSMLGIEAGQYASLLPLASFSMVLCSIAFIFASLSVCLGNLRRISYAGIAATVVFFSLFILLSKTDTFGSLQSAIIAQAMASICFIISGLFELNKRYFK